MISRMIPPFNDAGFLPQGVHPATFGEIAERFGAIGTAAGADGFLALVD
jgi:hypothetical protein